MSYNNFNNISPLIAVYENGSRTTTSSNPLMLIDTSLHTGTVTSNVLTVDYPCTLRGDFYGYSGNFALSAFSAFLLDDVEQYQSREINAGSGGGNIGGGEPFFANAGANVDIEAHYRTAGTATVTTEAKFPRITGVTIK